MQTIIVRGKIYSISPEFRHPGGQSVLRDGEGFDVSDNFESHHMNTMTLETIPGIQCLGTYDNEWSPTKYDGLRELKRLVRRRLQECGVPDSWVGRKINRRRRNVICLGFFGVWLLFYCLWFWYMNVYTSIGLGIWSFPTVINLFHSQTHSPDTDGAWSRYFYDFLGPSSDVWKYEHNILHHQYVNTIKDPDIRNGEPLLRFESGTPFRWYHRYQYLYCLPIYTLTFFGFVFHNAAFVFAPQMAQRWISPALSVGPISRRKYVLLKVPTLLFFFVVPSVCGGHALTQVLWMYTLCMLTLGLLAGVILDASHISGAVDSEEEIQKMSFIHQQSSQSVNICADSWIVNLLLGGLNLQIEHHLFPSLCATQTYYIHGTVRRFLLSRGLRYHDFSLWGAVGQHLTRLHRMSSPVPSAAPNIASHGNTY